MKYKYSPGYLIIYNLFLIVFLVSVSRFYNSWTNTLYRNNNWQSSKINLEKGLMGAWAFILSYRALAYNHLDIGTWHGYQELIYNKPVNLDSLSFDFKLSKNSYFTFFFSGNQDTLTGIRISNDTMFPTAFLRVVDCRFVEKFLCKLIDPGKGWNKLKIRFLNSKADIYINGIMWKQLAGNKMKGNMIGFRGCGQSTLIDNISFRNIYNQEVFYEDFGKKYSHWIFMLVFYIIFNLVFILFYRRKTFLLAVMVNAALIAGFIYVFFLFYGQNLYPKKWMIRWPYIKYATEKQDAVNERIVRTYSLPEYKNDFKIIFIGTSQTWGAGASREDKTFVRQFETLLKNTCTGSRISCINTGIPAVNSTDLLLNYRNIWLKIKPAMCILNLSFNDGGRLDFKDNLEQFVRLNNENNITTVFVLEPNALFDNKPNFNHNLMRKIAAEHKLQLIDIHNFLLNHHDDGFLYWDFIHLTDFGQKLFADKLFEDLKDKICSKTN